MEESNGARGRRDSGGRRSAGAEPLLRLGIVGCGSLVRGRHLPVLRQVPGIAVMAVADLDARSTAEAAATFGVPRRYATAEELAADSELDAIAVCTPPSAHVEPAILALDAGRPLFVEKPIAASLDDADRLLAHAARSPLPALMGFNLRWHRLLERARRLAREGALGWVHCMVSTFSDPLLRRELPAWRSRRDQGGGVIFDRAVHHFDLWRWLLDDEVVEVFAMGRSRRRDDDAAVITARLRGGAIATAVVLDESAVTHRVALFGTEGAVEVDVLRFDGFTRQTVEEYPGRCLLGCAALGSDSPIPAATCARLRAAAISMPPTGSSGSTSSRWRGAGPSRTRRCATAAPRSPSPRPRRARLPPARRRWSTASPPR